LRETVKRTGIKKRVWIHGFRHSRATHLSEHLTEQQMKKYLGWTAGSDMPAIYCHLSGKDMDKAVKAMYGIEEIENPVDSMKPGKCARCGEMNASIALYCFRCGLPLTTQAASSIPVEAGNISKEFLAAALLDPDMQTMIKNIFKMP